MKVILASYTKVKKLSAWDLNSIDAANVFIDLGLIWDIQSETTPVGSDNWYDKFIYSNIT